MQEKILIVDDNSLRARGLSELLERRGYETAVAPNFERAMEIVRSQAPALVLVDVKFPKLSGRLFLDEVKAVRADLPVMVTADLEDEIIGKFIKRVCGTDYILSPFDPEEVACRVRAKLIPSPEPALSVA